MRSKTLFFSVLALFCAAYGAQVVSSSYLSAILNTMVNYTVVLPPKYAVRAQSGKRFPVVYLLHCAGGSPANYVQDSGLESAVDNVELIVAMPYDGTGFGWWLDSPILPDSKLSSFLAFEFKRRIDSLYSTATDRRNTGIAGHSMGGFGALHNLAAHPDIFGVAFGAKSLFDLVGNSGRYGMNSVIGTYQQNPERYKMFDIILNAAKYQGKDARIRFYSGPQDWFMDENRRLHTVLDSLAVPHVYFENAEGHYPVPSRTMSEMLRYFDSSFVGSTNTARPQSPGKHLGSGQKKKHGDRLQLMYRTQTGSGTSLTGRAIRSSPTASFLINTVPVSFAAFIEERAEK